MRSGADERITLIKLDVEGSETEVLEGLRHTIEGHRPTIVIELNFKENSQRAKSTVERLRELGYHQFFHLQRAVTFRSRHVDFLRRLIFGERMQLVKMDEFDKNTNYLQIYCRAW